MQILANSVAVTCSIAEARRSGHTFAYNMFRLLLLDIFGDEEMHCPFHIFCAPRAPGAAAAGQACLRNSMLAVCSKSRRAERAHCALLGCGLRCPEAGATLRRQGHVGRPPFGNLKLAGQTAELNSCVTHRGFFEKLISCQASCKRTFESPIRDMTCSMRTAAACCTFASARELADGAPSLARAPKGSGKMATRKARQRILVTRTMRSNFC